MPEMHLRQPGFTYSACGPFTKDHLQKKKKKRIENFKEIGESQYIYQSELDKACFQYDMTYGDFKDLIRRTASDKILHDIAFSIAKNPKYMDIKGVFLQWFLNFLIKRLLVEQLKLKICLIKN